MRKFSLLIIIACLISALFSSVAFGANSTLYIYPAANTTIITGPPAVTTNLVVNNTSSGGPWVTNLSTSTPTTSTTQMQRNYTTTAKSLLGKAYYTTSYGSAATIQANATGTAYVKSENAGDTYTFTLFDYNPSGGATTTIGTATCSSTTSNQTVNQTKPLTFNNPAYPLPQGHFLMLQVEFTAATASASNPNTAILFCYSTKRSQLSLPLQFKIQTNNNSIGGQGTISATVNGAAQTIAGDGSFMADAASGTNPYAASTVGLSVSASGSYNITTVNLDGTNTTVNSGSYSTSITPINGDHNFTASFTIPTYSLGVSSGVGSGNDGGTISWTQSPAGSVHNGSTTISGVPNGTIVSFTVTPDTNYAINTVTLYNNGVASPQTITGDRTIPNSFNLGPISSGTYSIVATYAPTYEISVSPGAGGTITASGVTFPVRVMRGSSLSMTIAANTGASNYRIQTISDNGAAAGVTGLTTQVFSLTNITADHTIAATFIQTFSITTTIDAFGSFLPSSPYTADIGSSLVISVTPLIGYQVADVVVDGTSVGAYSVIPLINITSDMTVAITTMLSATMNSYSAMPSFVSATVPPNVMLMLSVETPMNGVGNPNVTCGGGSPAALNAKCQIVGDSCNGSDGNSGNLALGCYDDAKNYSGYFETQKCYAYSGSGTSGLFTPAAATTAGTHQCDGTKWSGNFLNWATAMALDNFRKAFTGGNRDPSDPQTIVAGRFFGGWYPDNIKIDNTNNYYMPSTYTGIRYLKRKDVGFGVCNASQTSCNFGTSTGSGETSFPTVGTNMQSVFSLRIKACDSTYGIENRCNYTYATPLPEGTLQQYASQMRFGLVSYLKDDDQKRDGGVLRSNIKWLTPKIPYGVKYQYWDTSLSPDGYTNATCQTLGGCTNPEAELNADGTFKDDPDGATGSLNSGVINYINKFGYVNGYKGHDPVGEMYYQVLRYFMHLGPSTVNNYCNGEVNPTGVDTPNDGFAVYCDTSATPTKWSWRDYNLYDCARNYVVAINDANPWLDKRIPGGPFTANYGGSAASHTDWCGDPTQGACDTDFKLSGSTTTVNVEDWTNKIGINEGMVDRNFTFGCEVDATTGVCKTTYNSSGQSVRLANLSRVVGAGGYIPGENSFLVSGLAYFAHMTNLRPDLNHCSTTLATNCTTDGDCPSGERCIVGFRNLTTYMIDTQEPSGNMIAGPRNVLYLAAKYGGYDDADGDGKPYNQLTKDGTNNASGVTNACGTAGQPANCKEWNTKADGYPDNYVFASDSSKVADGLNNAFRDILRRLASGTAASILSNSEGSGANLVQAIFYPEKVFESQTSAAWIGEMQDFWYFVDPFFGNSTIREDTNSNSNLDLIADRIVHFRFDGLQTWADLYNDTKGNGKAVTYDTTVTPDNMNTLWKAGNLLWARNLSTSPRHIFTTLDGSNLTDFLSLDTSSANIQSMFQVNNSTLVQDLIDYTKGVDKTGYRGRSVTQGGVNHVWKLGDIVSSTPKLQSSVQLNNYHLDPPSGYGDTTYKTFLNGTPYKNRGTTFAGANDGMLHAFKLGVLNEINSALTKATLSGTNLGKEEWAYIPRQVIPYLKYYADPSYGGSNHIFSVDGPTVLSDVSTVKGSCTESYYWNCPKTQDSWNTVLIGSMGVGGATAKTTTSCSDCVKTPIVDPYDVNSGLGYSSYFALDVTKNFDDTDATTINNTKPKLLWEFADPKLGYSTAGAAIVKINSASGSSRNGRWLAVIASGPTGGIDTTQHQFMGRSNQNLQIFVLDLVTGAILSKDSSNNPGPIDTTIPYAFAGTITAAVSDTDRWNRNGGKGYYQDDVLYIGYTKRVGNGTSTPYTWTDGGVLRIVIPENTDPDNIDTSTWKISKVIDGTASDPIGAVTTSIAKIQDRKNHNYWLYFGTGRYYGTGDDPSSQRRIYGVKDACYKQVATHTDGTSTSLDDIDDFDCAGTGTLPDPLELTDLDSRDTPSSAAVNNGWYINLNAATASLNAERVVSDPVALTNGVIYFTSFSPSTDLCIFGGVSEMWAVKYDTGSAPPASALIGKAIVQTSTGSFAEIDLSSAFTQNYGRKSNQNITGKPPSDPPPIITNSNLKPVKKILHIMER